MENKGIASAIGELGEIISYLRDTIEVKEWHIDKLNAEVTNKDLLIENKNKHIDQLVDQIMSKDARIKELEDMLSKRPERIKREDQGLDKWNK